MSLPLAHLERPIPWASPRRVTPLHTYRHYLIIRSTNYRDINIDESVSEQIKDASTDADGAFVTAGMNVDPDSVHTNTTELKSSEYSYFLLFRNSGEVVPLLKLGFCHLA